MSIGTLNSKSLAALLCAALIALAPAVANAKMGRGLSSGSRGSRTFAPPPPTRTAPAPAAPMQRSVTPEPAPQPAPSMAQPSRPSVNPAMAPGGGSFGRGLLGGLAGGLLGAGLFGLLSGHGFLGGLGGFASFIGLLLQLLLIVFLARLAIQWFAGRRLAGAVPGGSARPSFAFQGAGPSAGAGGGAPRETSAPINLRPDDFNAFERLLGDTQAAYSQEDFTRLNELATPEMVSYFSDDIRANAREGVVNRISDVKLLQGDLSEAWREGADEYATVAMRFSLTDLFVDRASGKTVSGSPQPTQSTELWTFRRPAGRGADAWKLSALQQAA
jgi:predicted lipid-binding transport protein (Tim44 family)